MGYAAYGEGANPDTPDASSGRQGKGRPGGSAGAARRVRGTKKEGPLGRGPRRASGRVRKKERPGGGLLSRGEPQYHRRGSA